MDGCSVCKLHSMNSYQGLFLFQWLFLCVDFFPIVYFHEDTNLEVLPTKKAIWHFQCYCPGIKRYSSMNTRWPLWQHGLREIHLNINYKYIKKALPKMELSTGTIVCVHRLWSSKNTPVEDVCKWGVMIGICILPNIWNKNIFTRDFQFSMWVCPSVSYLCLSSVTSKHKLIMEPTLYLWRTKPDPRLPGKSLRGNILYFR